MVFLQMVGRGSLFFDEIGELPLSLQPKLLRVLETRSYRPLGASEILRFEGRVIVATHRDLKALVQQERFREDLYYLLAVFELELPDRCHLGIRKAEGSWPASQTNAHESCVWSSIPP